MPRAELFEFERLVGRALVLAAADADFTDPALRRAVTTLGTVARARGVTAQELLDRLEALVCATLRPILASEASNVVLIYVWRFARRAHEGGSASAPPSRLADAPSMTSRAASSSAAGMR